MATTPNIVAVTPDTLDRALATLAAAFVADPVGRWIYHEARDYLENYSKLVRLFGSVSSEEGTFYADESFGGACVWLKVGSAPDGDAMAKHIEETVREEIREELFEVFEKMDTYHHQAEPCWYLPVIGADASRQGQGLGSALMKHALERVDEEGAQAYLESSNPANMTLYERHGFEVMGQIQVGSSPLIHPMIRQPR